MRYAGIIICLFITQICLGQFKITKPAKNNLPDNIQYSGHIVHAARWTDNTGDNIVLLTASDKGPGKKVSDAGYNEGMLYAYHFLVSGDSVRQTWKVQDFVSECPVDMILYFIDKAFAVTDLNKDGKAEVWIMYKVSCQGDVSPVPMKVIMYEDGKKFAIRGTTRVQVSANEHMGGTYTLDEAFRNAPPVFRQYAEKLWKQYRTEDWK